jgi:hypothetical protein
MPPTPACAAGFEFTTHHALLQESSVDIHFGTIVRALYLRGLALYDNYIFAGLSPATIVCIAKSTGKLVDYYFHNDDVRVCIHGLTVV